MQWTLRYRDRIMRTVNLDVDPSNLEEATAVGQDYVSMVLANPNITFVSVEPSCVHSSAAMRARLKKEAQTRLQRDRDLVSQRRQQAAPELAEDGDDDQDEAEDGAEDGTDGAQEADETEGVGKAGHTAAHAPAGRQAARARASSHAPGPHAPAPKTPPVPAAPTSRDKRRKEPPPTRTKPTRIAATLEAPVDTGHHVDPGQNEPTTGVADPRAHARNLVQTAAAQGRIGQ